MQKYDTPLDEATTPSLDALKAYSTGWRIHLSSGEEGAVPFFKQAIEIDPKFAMAYASLGLMYGSTGESALATENISEAYRLRERASDHERFFITAYYDGRATGNQEKAQKTCEAWAKAYPRDYIPHAMLAGFIYTASGRYQQAAEEAEKTIQLSPDAPIGYLRSRLCSVFTSTAWPMLKMLCREFLSERPKTSVFSRYCVRPCFLENDKLGNGPANGPGSGKNWRCRTGLSDREAFALRIPVIFVRQARCRVMRWTSHRRPGHRERAALIRNQGSLVGRHSLETPPRPGRARVAALVLARNREVQYGAAVALALSGESTQALILANDLEHNISGRHSQSDLITCQPYARLVALNHGEDSKARRLFANRRHRMSWASRGSAINGFFGALYPIYVRGEAYLAAREGPGAVTEFQKILDHRGAVVSDPIQTLAHLQLGRALRAVGRHDQRTKGAYQEFFSLWKNADPDIPILQQAKAEYARLN